MSERTYHNINLIVDYFFIILTILGVIFFLTKSISAVDWWLGWSTLSIATIFSVLAYWCQVSASYWWLSNSQNKINYLSFAHSYFQGNLARYIPGNVWAYWLRFRYGKRLTINSSLLAISMLFEVYWFVLAAAAWSIFLIPGIWHWLLFLVVIVLIHFCWYYFFTRLANWWLIKLKLDIRFRETKKWFNRSDLFISLVYLGLWLGWGMVLKLTIGAVNSSLSVSLIQSTAIFALPYLVGFLSFFTPSGLGVREITMTALLAPLTGWSLAGALAIWNRLIFTLGEIIIYGLFWVTNYCQRWWDSNLSSHRNFD